MTRLIAIAALAMLAACGVDGEPERPEGAPDLSPGIAISGRVELGVSGGSD